MRRHVGEALHRAAFLIDGDQRADRQPVAPPRRALDLTVQAGDLIAMPIVVGEQDHTTEMMPLDELSLGRRQPVPLHREHDELPDLLSQREDRNRRGRSTDQSATEDERSGHSDH